MRSTLHRLVAGLFALVLAASPLASRMEAQDPHDHGGPPAKPSTQPKWLKPVAPHRLPQLPYEGYPAPRPMSVVQNVYEFAARHPEVLNYMPCFCGCERSAGHRGNHDCFVRRRDAQGRVVEWDSHGYGCAVCIDVARDAMQMFNAGATVTSIRAAIDAKYASRFPSTTPTPKPPAAAPKKS